MTKENINNEDRPEVSLEDGREERLNEVNANNLSEVENESESKEENKVKKQLGKKPWLSIIALGTVISISAAAGYVFIVEPKIELNKASKQLSEVFENRGAITAVNTQTFDFKAYTDSDSSMKQKALGVKEASDSAVFTFDNKKNISNKRTVDLYIDFSSQRSRDFISINANALKSMVETGLITLNIHPVPTSHSLSAYSAEALALTFEKDSGKAWDLVRDLAKLSMIVADENIKESSKILEKLDGTLRSLNINSFSSEDILKGEYSSWVLSTADDPKLKGSSSIPAIYVDEIAVDQSKVDINNSQSLINHVRNGG